MKSFTITKSALFFIHERLRLSEIPDPVVSLGLRAQVRATPDEEEAIQKKEGIFASDKIGLRAKDTVIDEILSRVPWVVALRIWPRNRVVIEYVMDISGISFCFPKQIVEILSRYELSTHPSDGCLIFTDGSGQIVIPDILRP